MPKPIDPTGWLADPITTMGTAPFTPIAVIPEGHAHTSNIPLNDPQGVLKVDGARITTLTFKEITMSRNDCVLYETVEAMKAFSVISDPTSSHRFSARTLPWQTDKAWGTRLALTTERVFMTPPMNGCCVFACGPANAPSVVHANLITDDVNASTAAGRQKLLERNYQIVLQGLLHAKILTGKVAVVAPGDYGYPGLGVFFGIKRGSNWTFYLNNPVGGGLYRTVVVPL
jgi:hypothetical protein